MSTKRFPDVVLERLRGGVWIRPLAALACALTLLTLAALHVPATSIAVGESTPTVSGAIATVSAEADCAPLSGVVKPPARGAYVGVFRPLAPVTSVPLTSYKSLVGKPASMVMWFQPWSSTGANRFDTAAAVSAWNRGAVPIIVWEPWSPGAKPHDLKHPANMPDWTLSKIASGKYDAYITSFADSIKTAGGPVMISLFHEMNGCWYPWCGTVNGNSPRTFIAAWRRVHGIFDREGVTNVTWIWSINFESRPTGKSNKFSAYYPGNKYVDWVGVSGFNWGKGVGGGPWKSFETIYRAPLKYLKTAHKPVMITEFASVENGGNKASWVADAFRRVRTAHPEIKAVIYYDARERSHGHIQDWRINSSTRALKAYRSAVGSGYFIGGQTSALSNWRATLTADRWNQLLSTGRIYTK